MFFISTIIWTVGVDLHLNVFNICFSSPVALKTLPNAFSSTSVDGVARGPFTLPRRTCQRSACALLASLCPLTDCYFFQIASSFKGSNVVQSLSCFLLILGLQRKKKFAFN